MKINEYGHRFVADYYTNTQCCVSSTQMVKYLSGIGQKSWAMISVIHHGIPAGYINNDGKYVATPDTRTLHFKRSLSNFPNLEGILAVYD